MTTETILKEAEEMISQLEGEPVIVYYRKQKPLRMRNIKEAICQATGFTWEDVCSKGGRRFALARQLFSYLCMKKLGLSAMYVAAQIGQDHTTINRNKHVIQNWLDVGDDATVLLYSQVMDLL